MKTERERLFLLPAYVNGNEVLFIKDALRVDAYGHSGVHIEKFSEEIGEFLGIKGIRLVSNAPSALHLVCRLMGVKKGDKIICSASMPVELAEPILELGAELVLVDSDLESWNMSPAALKKALEQAAAEKWLPKFVVVSHSYGQTAKIDEICSLCKVYGTMVVEDAMEALGSVYKGKVCGTWGQFGIFSLDADKIITTSSGGVLVSSVFNQLGEELDKAFLHLPTTEMGYTYSMSNILAAMGRAQLRELEQRILNKQDIYTLYKRTLARLPGVSFPQEQPASLVNRWLTTIRIQKNTSGIHARQLIADLEKLNIEATLLRKPLQSYLSLKRLRVFSDYPGRNVSELLYESGLGLPSGSYMTSEEQFRVIVAFRNVYQTKNKTF